MITTTIESDDQQRKAVLDATTWFEQATDDQILALAAVDFGGDYEADNVARFYGEAPNADPRAFAVLDYVEDTDGVGFECHIDMKEACMWIRANRPDAYKRVQSLATAQKVAS